MHKEKCWEKLDAEVEGCGSCGCLYVKSKLYIILTSNWKSCLE